MYLQRQNKSSLRLKYSYLKTVIIYVQLRALNRLLPSLTGGAAILLAQDSSRTPDDVVSTMTSEATSGALTDTQSVNLLLYVGTYQIRLIHSQPVRTIS